VAVISRITCGGCGYESHVSHRPNYPPPSLCGACQTKKADADKADELAALEALPVEERLKRIEGWIYDWVRRPRGPAVF
jgi:hypothetical protein